MPVGQDASQFVLDGSLSLTPVPPSLCCRVTRGLGGGLIGLSSVWRGKGLVLNGGVTQRPLEAFPSDLDSKNGLAPFFGAPTAAAH